MAPQKLLTPVGDNLVEYMASECKGEGAVFAGREGGTASSRVPFAGWDISSASIRVCLAGHGPMHLVWCVLGTDF